MPGFPSSTAAPRGAVGFGLRTNGAPLPMNAGFKLQLAVIAASGMVVAILAAVLVGFVQHLTPTMMRYLLPIPPLSVAAYSFVFSFVRDRTGDLPGLAEGAVVVAQASFVSALLFALMAAGMLVFVRIGARFF